MRTSTLMMLVAVALSTLATTAAAKQVKLDVAMANPTMLAAGDGESKKLANYLRIGLTGFEMPKQEERMPVNVAIVIDKSGSMQGDKIEQAREAAIQAVDRLKDSDIVSIVTYDSSVNVVLPATKAQDRDTIKRRIKSISAGGNTALFAGVSKGAAELRKFMDEKFVNRIILLSDGIANVGPSSPADLEQLGASLIKDGISVSTMGLGLGYNEDLMSRLAMASSGNHVFIEDAENLVQVFQNEFDDVLSVVAQKIRINAKIAEGIRPVKVLNYPAEIAGQSVVIDLGQLYARQERYFVVELEMPAGDDGSAAEVADVSLEYMNMTTETEDRLTSAVAVKYSASQEIVDAEIDKEIMASCVIQIANERNRRATELRDAGRIAEAKELLVGNAKFLGEQFRRYQVPALELRCEINKLQSESLEGAAWTQNRKVMRQWQYLDGSQQRFGKDGQQSDFGKDQKSKK